MNVQETGECVKHKKIFSGFRNAVGGKVRKWKLPIHIGDNKPLKGVETYFKSAVTDAVSAEDDSSQTSISPEVQELLTKRRWYFSKRDRSVVVLRSKEISA